MSVISVERRVDFMIDALGGVHGRTEVEHII